MLVNITEYFIESGREWRTGENPDVPREVAERWIADGKATYDTDGVRDSQSPVSGGATAGGGGYVELPATADIDGMGLRSLYQWTLLTIPSPYSPGHVLHPSVLYFVNGWRGHRYWMAYTPYPNSTPFYENPCIAVSDDMVNWSAKGPQPIVDTPAGSPQPYNSDTELAYDAANDRILMIFRQNTPPAYNQCLYMMHTTDGVAWSTPALIYTGDGGNTPTSIDIASPSINWTGANWEIIGVLLRGTGTNNPLGKISSSGADPYVGWSTTPTELTITPPAGRDWWHGTVRRLGSGSYFAVLQDNNDTAGASGDLYVAYSPDGSSGNWAYKRLDTGSGKGYLWYRPSFLIRYDGVNEVVVDVFGSRLNTTGMFYQRCRIQKPNPYPQRTIDLAAILAAAAIGNIRGILAADTFARADSAVSLGTTTDGKTWTTDTGTIGILTNRAYVPATTNSRAYIDVGVANYVVSMALAGVTGSAWMVLRYQNASNYVRVGTSGAGDLLRYQEIVGGAVQNDTTLGMTPVSGDELTVSCIGPEIVVYLNGVRAGKKLNAAFAANTKVGLQMSGTSSFIDSFVAQAVV